MAYLSMGRKTGRKSRRGDDGLGAQLKLFESIAEEQDLQRVKQKLESLSLICRALWSFIQEHHPVTDEQLAERMAALTESEGTACAKCGRVINKTHRRCLYCGTDAPSGNIFDTL